MTGGYLIGIDLGTMGTKAGLYDLEGNMLADAYEESILRYPRVGWVEQELDEIYQSAVDCISAVLQKSGIDAARVQAVAFSSQMSGIGMINKNWEPVAHYDSWLDTRCELAMPEMEPYRLKFTSSSGCPPTYAHAAKKIWWRRHQPELFKQTAKFIVPLTYVAGKMAGLKAEDAYIDRTCLHFSGFSDTRSEKWSAELLDLYGIPEDKMPQIIPPTELIGKVTKKAAELTGLKAGTPIAAGAGDQAAASIGVGAVTPGDVFDSAGTASVFSFCVNQFKPDLEHQVVLASHGVVPGTFYALSFINGGGLNLRWFRDNFGGLEKKQAEELSQDFYALFDKMAEEVPPGSGQSLFMPHLQGRVLPPDPSLRGLWVGFTWSHTRAYLFRAIMEAVAYEYAYYLEIEKKLHPTLNFREVRAIGGGSSSHLWNQIKSDVLNLPYCRVNRTEVGTWGCAIIAGAAVGIFPDLAAAAKSYTIITERNEPRPEYYRFYRSYAELYCKMLEQYSEIFQGIHRLPLEVK